MGPLLCIEYPRNIITVALWDRFAMNATFHSNACDLPVIIVFNGNFAAGISGGSDQLVLES